MFWISAGPEEEAVWEPQALQEEMDSSVGLPTWRRTGLSHYRSEKRRLPLPGWGNKNTHRRAVDPKDWQ